MYREKYTLIGKQLPVTGSMGLLEESIIARLKKQGYEL